MMSETGSDSNGDSTFEFLNEKDSNNGTKNNSAVASLPIPIATIVTSQSETPKENVPVATTVIVEQSVVTPTISTVTKPSVIIEPSINVPLQDPNTSPSVRSDSLSGSFIDWIANNDFINRVAEKAKNSVDSMITTLDPGMKEFICKSFDAPFPSLITIFADSGGDVNILVASDKESKISPIREAFQHVFGRATVKGFAVQSKTVAAQPVGFNEGLKGAEERIQLLRSDTNNVPQNQVLVAVENFIAEITDEKWYDVGCVILDDPLFGINLNVFTQLTPIPNEYVNQMRFETPIDYPKRKSGYSVTIGHVMSQKLNVSHEEWHQSWTGVSRRDMLYQTSIALAKLYQNRLSR